MITDSPVGGDIRIAGPTFALGTPTSIGSLPHLDRGAAVAFVLERCPELPAAPSLPQLDAREGMVAQGLWGVPGIDIAADGTVSADLARIDPQAPLGDPGLLGAPFATFNAFLRAIGGRTEAFKLQLTGPVTLGLVLRDAGLPDSLAFTLAGAVVRDRARQMLAVARKAVPDAPLVVFLDEPGLVGGLGDRIPLSADQAIDLVSGALAVIEPQATTGVHCCGPADWRALLQAGPQILSLPVDAGIGESAGALGSFIERGGWVAWGAVPTDGPLGDSAVRLWRVLSGQWCELVRSGCDPVLLRRQALVTPECGLALHSIGQAEHVFDLTRRVAERLQDQIANVKLSVGA